jgi:hypothetical protein
MTVQSGLFRQENCAPPFELNYGMICLILLAALSIAVNLMLPGAAWAP